MCKIIFYYYYYVRTYTCRVDTSRIGNAIRRDIRLVGLATNHGRRRRRPGRHQPVCTPLIRSVLGQQWIMATVGSGVGCFLLLICLLYIYIYVCVFLFFYIYYYAYYYYIFLMVQQEINAIAVTILLLQRLSYNNVLQCR